jgi:signal transduction histidine kinase
LSLGLRLTLLNGLVLLLTIGVFAGVAYATQQQALQSSLDESMRDQARRIQESAGPLFERGTGRVRGVGFADPRRFAAPDVFIQVTARDGEIAGRSANLGEDTLPTSHEMLERALAGEDWFTNVEVESQALRMYVAPFRIGAGGRTGVIGMIQVARPLEQLQKNLGALQSTFLTVGAVGVLVSLIVGWLLARAALRPIDRLAATAHAIGAARDFTRRVPLDPHQRRDEVGRLAEDFNQMLGQLQAAYEQLGAALAAQRRFVADASHELRTPLTSLRGNVDLLSRMAAQESSAAGEDERTQILADMAAETERLTRLVADLLLLAGADAGQHLMLQPTEVGAVVREAFRAARFLREGVELRLDEVPQPNWVAGDADRLKQLVLILLDNALKYAPQGGSVAVGVQPLARNGVDGVAVRVSDTGPGIPPEEVERIFERFYRVDRARGAGGSGLGLAIARWIVEEHQGTIEVESTPGQGSTFTVWLPSVPPPNAPLLGRPELRAGARALAS